MGAGSASARQVAPVEPRLTGGAEIALLSLYYDCDGVEQLVALWSESYRQPGGYKSVLDSLEAAGLVQRHGLRHGARPTASAQIDARMQGLIEAIQRPVALSGDDADLLVGVAACGALNLGSSDYDLARHRIISLGEVGQLTRFIQLFCERKGIGSTAALADALLPLGRDSTVDPAAMTAAMAANLGGLGGLPH